MLSETVLITGGTGHLGFRVIIEALKAGFDVKFAVRSQTKADEVFATSAVKSLSPGNRLQSVLVPDMLVDGAYDEAIKHTAYAIHVASPISSIFKEGDDADEVLVKPAVKGTLNILEAARKAESVKRVVITSSIVAIIPFAELVSGDTSKVYDENSRAATPTGPYPKAFAAYAASKVAALNTTEKWMAEQTPSFDVVNIFPGYIIGSEDLTTDAQRAASFGTNPVILGSALGGDAGFHVGSSVHVDDVALAHIKALSPDVPGNAGYVTSQTTRWEDAAVSIAKQFPEAVKSGKLPNDGRVVTVPINIDEKRSEAVLGITYRGLEEQVQSAVGQYLSLL